MKTKMKFRIISFAFILLTCCFQNAYAGFPVEKGDWMISPMYSHYSARNYWNNLKVTTPYIKGGSFTSNYFGLYGVFGIEKNINFVFNIPYIIQTYSDSVSYAKTASMGDATVGIAYYFKNDNPYKHVSLTGSLIIPLYQNIVLPTSSSSVTPPYAGFQTLGIEAKLGFSGTNMEVLKYTYYDVEGGLRQYLASSGPTQGFFNATFGVPLNKDWKLAGTISGVTSSSGNSSLISTSTSTVNKDYGYLRFTLAAGYNISPGASIWGNIFTDVSGRSIGEGSGFSIFAVFKF